MAMRKRDDTVEVFPNAAGIDVGGSSHWVAVPRAAADEPVREFGTMTDELHAMADWLLACGIDTVALESTGVYWIPVYEVLEQRGLTVWLVDARQMKYVPGRKSDVLDCQWLQKLMSLGLLRAAWRPEAEVCAAFAHDECDRVDVRDRTPPDDAYTQLRVATDLPGSGIQTDRGSRENVAPHQRPRKDQTVARGHCLQGR
jgi:hypothetical protein